MTSIYQIALGGDFERLHPKMQWRFGFSSQDGVAQIGTGVMEEVWRGPWWTLPFLLVGSTRRVLFPSWGRNVPFTISNYAYIDSFGRETVTWARRFRFRRRHLWGTTPTPPRVRAFDATMVAADKPGVVLDYLGTHQHLAVDLHLSVDDQGGLHLSSGEQRFYEGPIAFKFPLLFSGNAEVREWWDEERQQFGIDVRVSNRVLGPLFGYRGWFDVVEQPCTVDQIPIDVRPLREERRP